MQGVDNQVFSITGYVLHVIIIIFFLQNQVISKGRELGPSGVEISLQESPGLLQTYLHITSLLKPLFYMKLQHSTFKHVVLTMIQLHIL